MVSKAVVERVIRKYGEAWVARDPAQIIKIFTPRAIYHERVLQDPFVGHQQIKKYWQSKVVGEQSNIKFKLLHIFIDGDTAIVEWDATFFRNVENKTIHLREVAILEFEGNKIKSLREYWHSERL